MLPHLPILLGITLLALPGSHPGSSDPRSLAVRATLFADGSVECGGADDTSRPVGTVALKATNGGVAFSVSLKLGPLGRHWPYYVELSQGGVCQAPVRVHGFATDAEGHGVFQGIVPMAPGPRSILVDVVSTAGVPPDPRLREIAPSGLLQVVVPDDGAMLLTLGLDGGSGSLPWSEQGFTFDGDGSAAGEQLSMFHTGFPAPTVTLTRDSGETFDAVALSADLFYDFENDDAIAFVTSDLGGFQELLAGATVLQGPGWKGITALEVRLQATGFAWLEADDFVVRVH